MSDRGRVAPPPAESEHAAVRTPAEAGSRRRTAPRRETPIVPKGSIAGRALVAVVAIMTFLSSLTVGAVMLVRSAASEWQADVARELTIQVRPMSDRPIDREVARAAEIARDAPGIASVRPFSREESVRLLEPWLGMGLAIEDLPVPRLIVIRFEAGAEPDLTRLRQRLTADVPGATLDDHRAWMGRMRVVAVSALTAGLAILALMLAATVLSVAFATRGAMAANYTIVEVLHFVGAKNAFIARQFQRHFLLLGLEGGAIGGGVAMACFLLAGSLGSWGEGSAAGDQLSLLFGRFSIGFGGYIAVVAQIALFAAVAALTSRHIVNRTLAQVE